MSDSKEKIEAILIRISEGKVPPERAWEEIKALKPQYVDEFNEQSWHSYIGNKFQAIIHSSLEGYVMELTEELPRYKGLAVLRESEVKKNEVLSRKLAIQYGDDPLLPDVDSVIARENLGEQKFEILAVVSSKTSLRERIAQACYWKLKFQAAETTRNINVFLATTDHDDDFAIWGFSERFGGKSRNRIIAEYELDGVYLLRDKKAKKWESDKVKPFEKIKDDIAALVK